MASLLVRTLELLAGFLPVRLAWSQPASHWLLGATPCPGPVFLSHFDPLLAPQTLFAQLGLQTHGLPDSLLLQCHGVLLIHPVAPEEQVIGSPAPGTEKDAFDDHQFSLRDGPYRLDFI